MCFYFSALLQKYVKFCLKLKFFKVNESEYKQFMLIHTCWDSLSTLEEFTKTLWRGDDKLVKAKRSEKKVTDYK